MRLSAYNFVKLIHRVPTLKKVAGILRGTLWIDHVRAHEILFKEKNIKSMIEFGMGDGTESFLKQLDKVASVEIFTKDMALAEKLKVADDSWAIKCKERFKGSKNWELIMYEMKQPVIDAELDVTGVGGLVKRGGNPRAGAYKIELSALLDQLGLDKYNYAFVDAGIHLRGDIVNLLFQRVPIIGAHDWDDKAIYGYTRINKPANYDEEEGVGSHAGIHFWIKQGVETR